MAIAYMGLGSNLGNKRFHLIKAAALLAERVGDILALSSFYETVPWGFVSTHLFLNAAVKIDTSLTPQELLRVSQQIEWELGRKNKSQGANYQDRIIDLDLLLYDHLILQTSELTIPHPQLTRRKFVLEPLSAIAPSTVVPGTGKTVWELLSGLDIDGTLNKK